MRQRAATETRRTLDMIPIPAVALDKAVVTEEAEDEAEDEAEGEAGGVQGPTGATGVTTAANTQKLQRKHCLAIPIQIRAALVRAQAKTEGALGRDGEGSGVMGEAGVGAMGEGAEEAEGTGVKLKEHSPIVTYKQMTLTVRKQKEAARH